MAAFLRYVFGLPAQPHDPNDVRTTFLFVEPSFGTGTGRVADLWGGFDHYTMSRDGREADMRAIYSDWRISGQDTRDALISAADHLTVAGA